MSKNVALAYGLGLAGAGAFAWWRGRRGKDLLVDTAVYGAIAGTGIVVVGYLQGEQEESPGGLGALLNSILSGVSPASEITGLNEGMGSLSNRAVKLLETIDPDILKPYKGHGVKIGEVPSDPNIITLDKD